MLNFISSVTNEIEMSATILTILIHYMIAALNSHLSALNCIKNWQQSYLFNITTGLHSHAIQKDNYLKHEIMPAF